MKRETLAEKNERILASANRATTIKDLKFDRKSPRADQIEAISQSMKRQSVKDQLTEEFEN